MHSENNGGNQVALSMLRLKSCIAEAEKVKPVMILIMLFVNLSKTSHFSNLVSQFLSKNVPVKRKVMIAKKEMEIFLIRKILLLQLIKNPKELVIPYNHKHFKKQKVVGSSSSSPVSTTTFVFVVGCYSSSSFQLHSVVNIVIVLVYKVIMHERKCKKNQSLFEFRILFQYRKSDKTSLFCLRHY